NPRDIAERVGPHRAEEYLGPAAASSKIEPITDCTAPYARAQTLIHSSCAAERMRITWRVLATIFTPPQTANFRASTSARVERELR
ncbi:MAG TPA: hypothetical protein VGB31_02980, partial [Myxococcota bacterium]